MIDTVTGWYRKTHYMLSVLLCVTTGLIQDGTEIWCGHHCVTQGLRRLFTKGKGG